MKPLVDQDHYETLEVRREATRDEIESAYRLACMTYAEDSLAGYPVFEQGDLMLLRQRIDIAFKTLSGAESRRVYDAQLRRQERKRGAPRVGSLERESAADSREVSALDALEEFETAPSTVDGAKLRRIRLRRGIEIDDIAQVTKINPSYLRFIEEERFAALPAAVYVRGFVMGYASCVGLEPEPVAASYMERFRASSDSGLHRRSST